MENSIQSEIAYNLIPKSNKILEIGCSSGYFSQRLLNKGREVYGIDINKKDIEEAKKKFRKINFFVGKAEKLPFSDNSFDVVVMLETLEHVDEKKAVKEAYRVLRPKGLVILSFPNKGMFSFLDPFNLKMKFKSYLPGFLLKSQKYQENLLYHKHYSLEDIKKIFSEKFILEKAYYRGLFFYPVCSLFSSLNRKLKLNYLSDMFAYLKTIDGKLNYGKLSYNLIIKARKNG